MTKRDGGTLYIIGLWVALLGLELCSYELALGAAETILGFILALVGDIKST